MSKLKSWFDPGNTMLFFALWAICISVATTDFIMLTISAFATLICCIINVLHIRSLRGFCDDYLANANQQKEDMKTLMLHNLRLVEKIRELEKQK